MHTTHLSALLS